jgi:hypothetical protein
MANGGFGIAAHVRLRFAFPLDWTRVSCRKYGYESDFGSSFLNGVCWTSYALIKFDLYVTVSNISIFRFQPNLI